MIINTMTRHPKSNMPNLSRNVGVMFISFVVLSQSHLNHLALHFFYFECVIMTVISELGLGLWCLTCGRDHMVVGFRTTYALSAYHH
jgi:hypothetical protein